MTESVASLRQLHPRHWGTPSLLFVTSILLAFGLYLPLLRLEKMLFWKSSYSVVTGVFGLAEDGQYVLATVVFFWSVVFPITKLALLHWLWFGRSDPKQRAAVLRWLDKLGKWSMLDVYIVAVLVVALKLGPLAGHVEPGFYVPAAVILSMLIGARIEKLARRAGRSRGRSSDPPSGRIPRAARRPAPAVPASYGSSGAGSGRAGRGLARAATRSCCRPPRRASPSTGEIFNPSSVAAGPGLCPNEAGIPGRALEVSCPAHARARRTRARRGVMRWRGSRGALDALLVVLIARSWRPARFRVARAPVLLGDLAASREPSRLARRSSLPGARRGPPRERGDFLRLGSSD